MKKLTVCLTLAAFAMVSSLQAGEKGEAGKAACSTKAAAACSSQAKAACAVAEVKKADACSSKTACSKSAKQRLTLKGATLLARL